MNKFIEPIIYEYINSVKCRDTLQAMKDDLSSEIENGLLVGPKYEKELQLLNIRLADIK